ncbi:MAG: 50S ribosomal protein L28 [Candidatus Margulisiibacteriota bacterium]
MASQCEVCRKIPGYGNSVSHSNRKTRRRWQLNLQSKRLTVNGVIKRIRICTGCLRTLANASR